MDLTRRPAIDVAITFPASGVDISIRIMPRVAPVTPAEVQAAQMEHERSTHELEVAMHVSSAVLSALDGASEAAAQVANLVAAQKARENMEAIEEVERRVAAERASLEQQATLAAVLAAAAQTASAEWEHATQLAARNAASRLADSSDRRESGARVLMATALAGDEQLAAARCAASAAAEAEAVAIRAANATPWSNGYVLVCEQGWQALGEGSYHIQRFGREKEARMVSDELWCCWVLYRELDAGGYEELLSGGVGFAQSAIRTYVQEHMEKLRRAARRISRGEEEGSLLR